MVGFARPMGETDVMSDLETLPVQPVVDPQVDDPMLEDGDHDRFAHYVRKDKVVDSAVNGVAIRALCGKKWIPNRSPEKFPVCPTCKEIYEQLRPGD